MFQIGDMVFNRLRGFHGIVTYIDSYDDACELYLIEKGKSGYWVALIYLDKVN